MKIDCRDQSEYGNGVDCWRWQVFDRDTGKDLTPLHLIAADDSTGQIIRYASKNGNILPDWPLVSEIRNIELVYMDWPK